MSNIQRETAENFGRKAAQKLLAGRTGHGGGPCTYRNMREADLIAFAIVAFEMGADWARKHAEWQARQVELDEPTLGRDA